MCLQAARWRRAAELPRLSVLYAGGAVAQLPLCLCGEFPHAPPSFSSREAAHAPAAGERYGAYARLLLPASCHASDATAGPPLPSAFIFFARV